MYRGHKGLESTLTHPMDHLALRQQRYLMPISAGEQRRQEQESDHLPLDTLLGYFLRYAQRISGHFHKQVPETQRRTMFSKSLQSESNTAACHNCQNPCGKAWYNSNQLLSSCRHPGQSQALCFQRIYPSVLPA